MSGRRAIPALLAGLGGLLIGSLPTGCASDGGSGGDGTRHIRSIDELLADPTPGVIAPDKAFVEFPDEDVAEEELPWSIALVTTSGDFHAEEAKALMGRITESFPELDGALFAAPVSRGSAVFYGRYTKPGDPAMKEAFEAVKAMQVGTARAFPRAMAARPGGAGAGPRHEWEIASLRERFPNADPLYTLQVAQWSTFGSDEVDPREMRRAAEGYCRQLRAGGFEAWFNHDRTRDISSVNIGAFGADAYDPRSTLYAPAVESLMEQFPALLVNGEPLMVGDPSVPDRVFPRPAMLVEVPE